MGIFPLSKIEYHSNKADMILRTLKQLKSAGYEVSEIIYVDDRTIHLGDIKKRIPNLRFIHMWVDVKSFEELRELLEDCEVI